MEERILQSNPVQVCNLIVHSVFFDQMVMSGELICI